MLLKALLLLGEIATTTPQCLRLITKSLMNTKDTLYSQQTYCNIVINNSIDVREQKCFIDSNESWVEGKC